MTRLAVQSAARAGTMQLLEDYKHEAGVQVQLYRARPRQVKPPTAYIEAMAESLTDYTVTTRQRLPQVRVRILWGLFDSGEAVDQRDAFVDGFLDWIADRAHAFGDNTLVEAVSLSDEPLFNFDGTTYFSSVLLIGGFAAT